MSEKLYCPECGHEIDRANPVCPGCGTVVEEPPQDVCDSLEHGGGDGDECNSRTMPGALGEWLVPVSDVASRQDAAFPEKYFVLRGCVLFLRFSGIMGWVMIAMHILLGVMLSITTDHHFGNHWGESWMTAIFGSPWIGWMSVALSCLPPLWVVRFSQAEEATIALQIKAAQRLRIDPPKATGGFWYWTGIVCAIVNLIWGISYANNSHDGVWGFLGLWGAIFQFMLLGFMGCFSQLQVWSRQFAQRCMELTEAGAGTEK